MTAVNADKAEIRREIKSKIIAMSSTTRRFAERRLIVETTVFLRQWLGEEAVVMAYVPLADEPEITPLLSLILDYQFHLLLPAITPTGKMVAREVTDLTADLVKNSERVSEPKNTCSEIEPSRIDAVIVPGRAFTESGDRLGRGGGFYDRFLPHTPARRLALAFRCQLVKNLPLESHDQKMHQLFIA